MNESNIAESRLTTMFIEDYNGEILSVSEACAFLRVHRNTLYRLIKEGEVPAFRLSRGGPWKFKRGDLVEWIEVRQMRSVR